MDAEALKQKVKAVMFDQYGTVVDMQGGLTEFVAPFLKSKGVPGFADGGFVGTGLPNFAMPNFSSAGGNGSSTITIQLVGSDSKFMSALASTIRSQGGDPGILTRKVRFA